MKPMKPSSNLAPVLFLMVVIAGIFIYAIKFYKVEKEEAEPPTPEKKFDVVEFIDKSIADKSYRGARYGSATLKEVVHYPKAKLVKFMYRVSSFRSFTEVDRARTVEGLLSKACADPNWRRVLKSGYTMKHRYNTKAGNNLLTEVSVTTAKCLHRDYPGKDLDGWYDTPERGDIIFKSYGPAEGKSELYTAK